MKIETQELDDRQVELRVEITGERVERAMRSAARQVSKRMKIPGFRPGKAPYDIVLRNVGHAYLLEEALESLGQEVYREALEQSDLDPFAPGALEEVVSSEPLILRYTVPLSPQVELGSYRDLRLDYQGPEIEDETVEEVLEELRQGQALIEPADRAAGMGDVVVMDLVGKLVDSESEDGVILDEENVSLLLDQDTDWPIPDISSSLVGMEAGQETSVEHQFPEDYANESMRGRTARFEIQVHEVKSRLVPEWSDDLARNLGDFDDLLALRLKVRENLTEESVRRADSEYADEVLDALVEQAQVSFPPMLLDHELDDMLADLGRQLRGQNLTLEDYLKIEGKSEEELRDELTPRATERLKRGLVLNELVKQEGLEVSDAQIDHELDDMISGLGEGAEQVRERLNTPRTRRSIELDLLTGQAVKWLVAIAKGEDPSALESTEPAIDITSESPQAAQVKAEILTEESADEGPQGAQVEAEILTDESGQGAEQSQDQE